MKMDGSTIVITGGGSGIGSGLAEAFAVRGNQVIVAGRRKEALDEVARRNANIRGLTLDVDDAESIKAFAARVAAEFPKANVLINNFGIMRMENLAGPSAMSITRSWSRGRGDLDALGRGSSRVCRRSPAGSIRLNPPKSARIRGLRRS